jgi:hypothetical protein
MNSKDFVEENSEDAIISGPMLNVRGTVRYFGLRTTSFELLLNG